MRKLHPAWNLATTVSMRPFAFGLPPLQGVLPIKASRIPAELIAGLTLAALAVPEVMGYTRISGTPVITGLYFLLLAGICSNSSPPP